MTTRDELESELDNAKAALRVAERELANFEPDDGEGHDRFDKHMQEQYGDVSVCGVDMDALTLLKAHDEPAYDQEYTDWLDGVDMSSFDGYDDLQEAVDDAQAEVERLEVEIDLCEDEA